MAWNWRVGAVLALLIQLELAVTVEARMESQLGRCCGLGTSWAAEGLKCEKFIGPVTGVPQVEQGLCLETVDICCVRAYREKQCELGKSDARAGKACFTAGKSGDGEYKRDCCEGCKLGLLTGSIGQGCSLTQFKFGNPWDPAFLECCREALPSTTADSSTTTNATTGSTSTDTSSTTPAFSIPTPALDDICQLMRGMLCSDICIPTQGSYVCACREGFVLLEDGKTCIQNVTIDRCKRNDTCEQRCEDTGEAVVCSCNAGYTLAEDQRSCIADRVVGTTPPNAENEQAPKCPPGYRYNAASQVCDDVDECVRNVCGRGTRCENTVGSFICLPEDNIYDVCPPGYRLDARGTRCIDIDECQERLDACDRETHVCVNSQGSFTCHELKNAKACPAGFKFDKIEKTCKDVDECAEKIHECLPDTEECRNTDGGYECDIKCQNGFTFSVRLGTCVDVDECAANGTSLCPDSICVNNIGGYDCANSKSVSRGAFRSNCPAGYKPTNEMSEPCIDVDECNEQLHSCEANERCVNEVGSFRCDLVTYGGTAEVDENISQEDYRSEYKEYPERGSTKVDEDEDRFAVEPTCLPGFVYNYDTEICDDVDECATNRNNCTGKYMQCANTIGSFRCDCQSGFELNITTYHCQDIDECARGFTECSSGERCVNSVGSHQCSPACPPGLQPHPRLENVCQDIDECELGLHSCPLQTHVCVNTNGSYVCDIQEPCRSGYERDAASGQCVDVDECASGPGCREHERCRNLPGSYDCSPLCGSGWLFNPKTKSCQDADECLLGHHNCPTATHTCENTDGSFRCVPLPRCERGYERAFNGSCVDVDECLENTHNCVRSQHSYCVNRVGSFECITRLPPCEGGYEYSLKTMRCEDVDECLTGRVTCDARLAERCVNLPGSYRCERPPPRVVPQRQPACPAGYRYQARQRQCVDIDECAESRHNCGDEVCYNQPGGYTCHRAPSPITRRPANRCVAGSRPVGNRCVDVDECVETEDACSSNEVCVNTPGSFYCSCKSGFRRDNFTGACVDINECQLENDCLTTQRCDNTIGSYTCVRFLPCGTGYTLNAATEICEDDDECLLGTHDCSGGYHCRNTLGSYRCDRNPRGYVSPTRSWSPNATTRYTTTRVSPPTRFTTISRPTIACPLGYQASDGQCVDVNECEGSRSPCNPTHRCVNTVGSYRCVSRVICGNGYALDPTGLHCIDVDECAAGTHECGAGQTCENRQGGYLCSCPVGHTIGPNKDCVDIDECSLYRGQICSGNSVCENTVGSYRCNCKSGFESVGNGCQDVDECAQSPGLCQHVCLNAWGSYKCACRPGFRLNLDNRSCTDVDECAEFKENNLCIGICENTPGSYACKCPNGYRLGVDGRTCQDIDECATGRYCRGADEMCQNVRGDFRCNRIDCPAGYYRDLERKNRCVRTNRFCQSGDLACLRLPSHYSYNFITFVSMLPIPSSGQQELFTMRGTHSAGAMLSTVQFSLALVGARAPPGVERATERCFKLRRPAQSQAVLVLTTSIQGPQEIELDLSMEIYHDTQFVGSAVAKVFIFVSQYEF